MVPAMGSKAVKSGGFVMGRKLFAGRGVARCRAWAALGIALLLIAIGGCSDDPDPVKEAADACDLDADCGAFFADLQACEQAFCDVGHCQRRTLEDGAICGPPVCMPGDTPAWRPARTCLQGLCLQTQAEGCADNEVCTTDSCDVTAGCVNAAAAGPCDDGSKCTTGDACKGGVCAGGAKVCECEIDKDCIALDDGNPCNGTMICNQVSNKCLIDPSSVVACDPALDTDCVQNQCNPVNGACELSALPKGTECDDGNSCTEKDQCIGGTCVGDQTCK